MSSRDQAGSPSRDVGDYDRPAGDEDDRADPDAVHDRDRDSDRGEDDEALEEDDEQARHQPEAHQDGGRRPRRDNQQIDESLIGSRRIFVGNLPWSTTNEDCIDYFSKYGPVEKAQIIYKKDEPGAGRSRGIAFVTFTTEEATQAAANDSEPQYIGDRRLNIEIATMQGHSKFRPSHHHSRDPRGGGERGGPRRDYDRGERERPHRSTYDRPDRDERRRDRAPVPRDPYDGPRHPKEEHAAPRRDMYTDTPPRAGRRGDYADDGRGPRGDVYVGDRDRDRGGRRGTPPGGGYPTRDGAYDMDPRDQRGGGRAGPPMSRDARDMAPVRGGYIDERVPVGRGGGGYDTRDGGYDPKRGGRDAGGYHDAMSPGGYRDEPPHRYAGGRDDVDRQGGAVYSDQQYSAPRHNERGAGRYESDMAAGERGYSRGRGDDRAGRSQPPSAGDRRQPPMERGHGERYERDYAQGPGGDRYAMDRGAAPVYDDYAPPPRAASGRGGDRGDRGAPGGVYHDGGDYHPRGGKGDRFGSRGGPPSQAPDSFYARGHGVYERNGGDRKEAYPPRRVGGR